MKLFSPLEQFELFVFKPIIINGWLDVSITNASLFLVLGSFTTLFFLIYSVEDTRLIPTRPQFLTEILFTFVVDVVKQQCGKKGLPFLPLIFSLFIIVLSSNLIGLFPFAFTPTSHLAFTFFLALSCNIALIIIGFYFNGLKFLKLFVPKGGPAWLIPLIVIIELLSYLLRTFSLSIRLFANMMAGHTLLHILSSFCVAFLKASPILAIFPIIMVLAVFALELGIAFLQAYVFIVLLSIYLNDSLHPSH
jgi:F-type H+-transporting ATPase subunit a